MNKSTKGPKLFLLGPSGSFSDIAASKISRKCEKKYVRTIADIFKNVGEGDFGLIPLKNKLVGGIAESIKGLRNGAFPIMRKYKIPVNFVLAAPEQMDFDEINRVYCPVVVRKQCKKFIKKHLKKSKIISDFESSSIAFKKIVQKRDISAAAIGSGPAAKIYNFKILASDIQDEQNDWTQFALICRSKLKTRPKL